MRLHPAYFYDFLEHPFTVNREVDDYKELYDSIKQNGINEPVKARPRTQGGLELLSGHRRHDIAMQLNYPVPVVIVQMDDDTARIEVVDGNLHRQDIPTSELARAAKMKMEALARKAGRRSKMEQLTSPQKRTDQIVAEDMGMSRNQVNRLVRIDSLVPELKKQVDDVVCRHFGIDTAEYSFGYIAGWSKGRELPELRSALECIRSTAAGLIDGIESRCPELLPPEPVTEEKSRPERKQR